MEISSPNAKPNNNPNNNNNNEKDLLVNIISNISVKQPYRVNIVKNNTNKSLFNTKVRHNDEITHVVKAIQGEYTFYLLRNNKVLDETVVVLFDFENGSEVSVYITNEKFTVDTSKLKEYLTVDQIVEFINETGKVENEKKSKKKRNQKPKETNSTQENIVTQPNKINELIEVENKDNNPNEKEETVSICNANSNEKMLSDISNAKNLNSNNNNTINLDFDNNQIITKEILDKIANLERDMVLLKEENKRLNLKIDQLANK